MNQSNVLALLIREMCSDWPDKTPLLVFREEFEMPENSKKVTGQYYHTQAHFPTNSLCKTVKLSEDSFPFLHSTIQESNFLYLVPPICSSIFLPKSVAAKFPRRNLEEIITLETVQQARTGSKILLLLPTSTLTNQINEDFRRALFAMAKPLILVEFKGFSLGPQLIPSTTFIQLEKRIDGKEAVRFFSIPEGISDKDILKDFSDLLKQQYGKTRFGYVLWNTLPTEARLSYEIYLPEMKEIENDLANAGSIERLESLFHIKTGLVISKFKDKVFAKEQKNTIPLLAGKNIVEGHLILEDTNHILADAPAMLTSMPGDILIRKITRLGKSLNPVIIRDDYARFAFDNSIICLRPKGNLPVEDIEFIAEYLRSDYALRKLKLALPGMSDTFVLSPSCIRSLSVPMMDNDLRLAVATLNEASNKFREWSAEADESKRNLFAFTGIKKARNQIITVGRSTRLRLQSALSADDLSYRIRTQFPHPIAFRWRTIETSHVNSEGYENILECAETLAAYLGILALVMSSQKFREGALKTIRKKISTTPRGICFADWLNILQEFRGSKNAGEFDSTILSKEMVNSLKEESELKLFQSLTERRNDKGHCRGPKERDL